MQHPKKPGDGPPITLARITLPLGEDRAREADSQFLYVTTTGWRSGRPHRIEIWFVQLDGRYFLISELRERAHWVQNIESEPGVVIEVGGEVCPGEARLVLPESEPELVARVSALFDAKYGWSRGLVVELRPKSDG